MMSKKLNFLDSFIILLSLVFLVTSCMSMSEKRKRNIFHRKMGVSKMMEGDDQAAFIEFQKALEYIPDDKESYNLIGLFYYKQNNYKKAVEYYLKAIDIDKHYAEAYNNLGAAYMRLEKWDEALEVFDKALSEPMYATPERALFNKGAVYYYTGEYLKAIDSLEEVLRRSPDFTAAYYYKGLIYLKLDRKKDAINEFKQAIEGYPDYVEAHWELANIYLRDGNSQEALHHFERIVKSKSRDKEANVNKIKEDAKRYIELLKGD
jgi:Tfp pilus assembly protein PilF